MYTLNGMYQWIGSVIIALIILSVVALIVCLIDRARWKKHERAEKTCYVIEIQSYPGGIEGAREWNPFAYVVGRRDAMRTLGQVKTANPRHTFRIRQALY